MSPDPERAADTGERSSYKTVMDRRSGNREKHTAML